ncbi:DUF4892 domain-containing protein [Aliikangiella sp. IMCC44632]
MNLLVKTFIGLAIASPIFVANAISYDVKFKQKDAEIIAAKDHPLLKRFPKSVIFDYTKQSFAQVDVVLSAVSEVYSEVDSDYFYEVTNAKKVSGNLTQLVYDLPEKVSPSAAANYFMRQLSVSNFQPIFKCSKADCGVVSGWKSFVNASIEGLKDTQEYFVVESDSHLVVFYASEIASQTRAVIGIVERDESANKTAQNKLLDIYFPTGRSNLDRNHKNLISSLKSKLANLKDMQIVVAGYADFRGKDSENHQLSLERALSVKKYLAQALELAEEQIKVVANGEKAVKQKTTNESKLRLDRRVEISLENVRA